MFLDQRTTQERDHKHVLEKLGKDYIGMGSGEGLACLPHYTLLLLKTVVVSANFVIAISS